MTLPPTLERVRPESVAKVPARRLRAGVLGATGVVGQRLLAHLDGHPFFEVTRVMASNRSRGLLLGEAGVWRLPGEVPRALAHRTLDSSAPTDDVEVVFSALTTEAARTVEPAWARAGAWVFSNAATHRMDADVPLVIPEVNPDHLALVDEQRRRRGWSGAIVTNANCSTTFLAMALAPLQRAFGVSSAIVSTMQAASGAGYHGLPAMDILGNVLPHIPGEEAKIETETAKLLGRLDRGVVRAADLGISAHANRVAVVDGHMATVSVELRTPADPVEVEAVLRAFRGQPQELELPSAPPCPVHVVKGADRPQPVLDALRGAGMVTVVGRIRRCPVLDIRMVVLGHNTIRGAGPGSVLTAELAVARGLVGEGG